MASIRKRQVIKELSSKYGITVKSVQKLNQILQEMGIIQRRGDIWLTTQKGLEHSIFSNTQVINADLWHESLVDEVAKFLKSK